MVTTKENFIMANFAKKWPWSNNPIEKHEKLGLLKRQIHHRIVLPLKALDMKRFSKNEFAPPPSNKKVWVAGPPNSSWNPGETPLSAIWLWG